MSEENVEIVRGIHDEWARGNLRAGTEFFDGDVVYITLTNLPDSGRFLGPEGIRDWMLGWLSAWDNFSITAEELIEAGESVITAVRQRGIGKQSGAPTELVFFQVWTFRARRIIRIEQFLTKAEALEAVGLSE